MVEKEGVVMIVRQEELEVLEEEGEMDTQIKAFKEELVLQIKDIKVETLHQEPIIEEAEEEELVKQERQVNQEPAETELQEQ
jgi:hypothetical protein